MVNFLMQYLKIFIIYISRIIFRIFYIFPVKEQKILFASHLGKQYSCNPRYVFEYIYHKYGNNYQFIWCLNDTDIFPFPQKNIKFVKYFRFNYCHAMMTAKYIVINQCVDPIFPFRKNQIVINTWHGGGAYKGSDIKNYSIYKKYLISMVFMRNIRIRNTNYIIASCKAFIDDISANQNVPRHKFLQIGMPRNDMFFRDFSKNREKVYAYYNLEKSEKIVLYAPTMRGTPRQTKELKNTLDIHGLLDALQIKFGGNFQVFFRSHFSSMDPDMSNMISVSSYPDMQELLCAADVLITDYSSSIWDFSFTFKPCFLFAPDLEEYKTQMGFAKPIEEWPFPLAQTNETLFQNILTFNFQHYTESVKWHHAELESYETGQACKRLYEIVFGG